MNDYENEYNDDEWKYIKSEFTRLNENYLDHAGTTLYSEKQIKSVFDNLSTNLYCSPHTSKTTEDLIDQVRFRILKHFNTDSSQYDVVFTSGATNSLKLVAESFSFKAINRTSNQLGSFNYIKENHTSVLGMREVVDTNQINPIDKNELLETLNKSDKKLQDNFLKENEISNSLLVISAQCNFSGYKFPLNLIKKIRKHGIDEFTRTKQSKWFVCLDAASFASTNFLDLSQYQPDFVCISFYKIFGYPTGLGALLVLKESEYVINKKYYGGGTVKIAMSDVNWHRKRNCLYERLEDGTISFLSIIALLHGFNTLERLIPRSIISNSMQRISKHTFNLASYLYNELKQLKYINGNSVVKLYTETDFLSMDIQGGILNFNILHSDGNYVGFAEAAYMATIHNIMLRTGCFCNPGACKTHLKLSDDELRKHYKAGHICGDSNDLVDGIPTGSIRVSIGYMTTKENVDAVINMIKSCYLNETKVVESNLNRSIIKENYKLNSHIIAHKHTSNESTKVKLKQICVYPIKSCGPAKISNQWALSSKGLLYDREWMVINDNGVALTQKTETNLCLIKPKFELNNRVLVLTYPGMNSISIPLDSTHSDIKIGDLCQSKVCGDRVEGVDCGNEIADWLSNALNISGLRLVRQIDKNDRLSKKSKNSLSLSNESQFLLINSSSVKWLAEKVDDWIEHGVFPGINLESVIDRFRGNIIIESDKPLDENNWTAVQIGNVRFKVEGPCSRCQMICIDQATGLKTSEPLKTIAKEFQGKLRFGLYLTQTNSLDNLNESFIICTNDQIIIETD